MDIYSDEVKSLATAIECFYYARDNMEGVPRFANREELLSFSINNISLEGMALEFGVATGHTINHVAEALPEKIIYGFDSFEGLPEAWTWAQTGHFAQKSLPPVRGNVQLIAGWFDRVLPTFLDEHSQKVAFLHVDCDLYSSTQTVLAQLRERIVPGTIIVFDEYFNYPEWRRHEFLAFQEFVQRYRARYEYIGLVPRYEQVAVRILP